MASPSAAPWIAAMTPSKGEFTSRFAEQDVSRSHCARYRNVSQRWSRRLIPDATEEYTTIPAEVCELA
jgi:hypothetical protein